MPCCAGAALRAGCAKAADGRERQQCEYSDHPAARLRSSVSPPPAGCTIADLCIIAVRSADLTAGRASRRGVNHMLPTRLSPRVMDPEEWRLRCELTRFLSSRRFPGLDRDDFQSYFGAIARDCAPLSGQSFRAQLQSKLRRKTCSKWASTAVSPSRRSTPAIRPVSPCTARFTRPARTLPAWRTRTPRQPRRSP